MPMPQFPPQPPVDLALSPVQELLVVIKVCVHSWILGILCHEDAGWKHRLLRQGRGDRLQCPAGFRV